MNQVVFTVAGRRRALMAAASTVLVSGAWVAGTAGRTMAQTGATHPQPRWYHHAEQMRRLAEGWGDQPYGAVVVLGSELVGEGPSRVVKNRNPDAHAEREAIRDAQLKLGRQDLAGAVLYSTSRPCGLCEAAAARAGVRRMYFGPLLADAGVPRSNLP